MRSDNLGSQPRKPGRRRGGRRGRTGRGGGEGGDKEEAKRRDQIYGKARRKLIDALKTNDFSYAAQIAASVTVSQTSVQDVVSLFLAGAEAFREGRDREWTPRPEELATDGLRYAREKTGYELTPDTRELFNNILSTNLRKIGEKKGRKYP